MINVLVVDDVPDNLEMFEEILIEYGFKPTTAQSIEEAVAIGTTQPFEIILMDMAIPQRRFESPVHLGGLEAVRQIHSRVDPRKLPVIAITCMGMEDTRQKIFEAGISHNVEKSIDLEQRIIGALEAVLGRSFPRNVSSSKSSLPSDSEAAPKVVSEPVVSIATATMNSVDGEVNSIATVAVATVHSSPTTMSLADESPSKPIFAPEPSTGAELRSRVASGMVNAMNIASRLAGDAIDTERNAIFPPLFTSLIAKFDQIVKRLENKSDGPVPGENHGHWIINLILGADREVRKLAKLEEEHHFGAWSSDFAAIRACFEQAFQAARGPAGLERVPVQDVPKMQALVVGEAIVPSSETSKTLAQKQKKEIPPEHRLILIVDDNPDARRDLEEKLQQLRYRVVSCENAMQALLFIETMRFDVCLVDLDMPEVNGLDLIKKIRNSTISSDASIIVVSGSPELFTASDAIDGGADDYLEKPANRHFLQSRIRSCLRQSDARLAELSRFLPEDVAKRVSSNRELLETAVPADISVMVCDIRGFSRVSERVGPMRTIKWISDVMNRLSKIILNRGGTIIDYVGDEIMAMWGAPIASQDHATDACNCALAVQVAVQELSEKWLPIVGSRMEIGIGVNSGLAVVGNTGSKDRIKFGPLGNTVNMASRVQGATKYLHSSILITQETAGRIDAKLRGRRICAVRVQNINEPVNLYELAIENPNEASLKCCRLYSQALDAFEKQDLDSAIALLAELLKENPQDGPSKLLIMRVIQNQLGGTFDPIWTLPGK